MAKCNIGGQAVLEGVMMRGKSSAALAVIDASGNVRLCTKRIKPKRGWWRKTPFVRGFFNLIDAMIDGVKYLLMSAEVSLEDEEDQLTSKQVNGLMTVSVILGLALFVGMFMLLPNFLTSLLLRLANFDPPDLIKNLIEGGFRLALFIAYLLLVSKMKDIKRVFMFHGAEHRTINCYEKEMALTVENVQKCSSLHDRCGTSFMFFVMVISILVFSLTGWGNIFVRLGLRVALLPVISGISYELLRLLSRYNIFFLLPFTWIGKAMQLITTKKPEDAMVRTAIVAFNAVLAMDNDESIPAQDFPKDSPIGDMMKDLKLSAQKHGISSSDIDWIVCEVLNIKRGQLQMPATVKASQIAKINSLVEELKSGKPLQYILGHTEFYGLKFYVDNNVLIPRMETEQLVEQAIISLKETDGRKVLDLCCGSGCIGLSISKKTNACVTLSDKSAEALEVAKRNAESLQVQAGFVQSDMFESLTGKFDLVVSNPPYIPSEDIDGLDRNVKFEPRRALDGGKDGLDFYRLIVKDVDKVLKENGLLMLEVGINQARKVSGLLAEKFRDIQILNDYEGLERVIIGKLSKEA